MTFQWCLTRGHNFEIKWRMMQCTRIIEIRFQITVPGYGAEGGGDECCSTVFRANVIRLWWCKNSSTICIFSTVNLFYEFDFFLLRRASTIRRSRSSTSGRTQTLVWLVSTHIQWLVQLAQRRRWWWRGCWRWWWWRRVRWGRRPRTFVLVRRRRRTRRTRWRCRSTRHGCNFRVEVEQTRPNRFVPITVRWRFCRSFELSVHWSTHVPVYWTNRN